MNLNPIRLETKEEVERFLKAIEESEKAIVPETKINYKRLTPEETRKLFKEGKIKWLN